jgi:hypothetical protein
MKKIISGIVTCLIFVTIAFSQPILKSEPQGNKADFVIMTVEGTELPPIELVEKYNWTFFKDLQELNLPDGLYEVMLRVGNENEESDDIFFYILIETTPTHVKYEIQPDPTNKDPLYILKFGDNLVAEVSEEETVVPPDTNPDSGGGGGGGGCFINTL